MGKKILIGAISAILGTLVVVAGTVFGGYVLSGDSRIEMPAGGYILQVDNVGEAPTVAAAAFAEGTTVQYRLPDQYSFKDVAGDKITVPGKTFVHYSDGSITALAKGIIVDPAQVESSVAEFYNLQSRMVLTSNGDGFTIDNNGNTLPFKEVLWVLDDSTMLFASPKLDITLSTGRQVTTDGFAEVTMLADGIVQIATANEVYTCLADNTEVKLNDGAVFEAGTGTLRNSAGTAGVTVNAMALDLTTNNSTAVAVNSTSSFSWKPPVFEVTAANGEDGEDGSDGDAGESGQKGESGADGSTGSTGGQGSLGGTPNAQGNGTGGQDITTQTLGSIRVASMSYNASAVSFNLSVSDDDETLTASTCDVEIRDASTNQLVWSYSGANGGDRLNVKSITADTTFHVDTGLNPNTEYVLIVRNGYELETINGTSTGNMAFVSRHFYTSTDGIAMKDVDVGQDKLTVSYETQDYCTAKTAMVRVQVGDKYYDTLGQTVTAPGEGNIVIDLNNSELKDALGIVGDASLSNTDFTVTLFSSESTDNTNAFNVDPATGEFEGDVTQSSLTVANKTRKQIPVFGPFEVVNANQGYYALNQAVVSDPDKAITLYEFVIVDSNGDEVAVLQGDEGYARWDYPASGTYKITSRVTYNDNHTTVTKEIDTQTVMVSTEGNPVLTFVEYTEAEAQQKSGTPAPQWGKLYDETRMWGDLIVNLNGCVLTENEPLNITVTCGANTYKKQITANYGTFTANAQGIITIPMELVGLTQDTIYTITVDGTRDVTTGVGSTSVVTKTPFTLGRTFFKTVPYDYPTDEDKTAVAFEIIQNQANGMVAQVSLTNTPGYTAFNSTDPSSPYFRTRAQAAAVEFTVYSQNGVEIGKFVKSIYEASNNGVGYNPAAYNANGNGYDANSDATDGQAFAGYLNGPLVRGDFSLSDFITIDEDDLKSAGLTDVSSGIITIEASAVYDYNWYLQKTEPLYINEFISPDEPHHNRIPLTSIQMSLGGVLSNNYLNKVTLNLGNKPPVLYDPADQQITVTPILNGSTLADGVGAKNPTYADDAIAGFFLQSNYENANGDTNSITYYAMKKESFVDYQPSTYNDPVEQYIGDLKKGVDIATVQSDTGILYAITLGGSSISRGSVPGINVLVDPEDSSNTTTSKWKDYWELDTATDIWNSKPKETNPGSGIWYVFVPSDWMPKGYCYVWAYTLQSFYGVSGMGDTWTYPYDINIYNSTQQYTDKSKLPRNKGTDYLKEAPRVAAQLLGTHYYDPAVQNGVQSLWQFFVYDPDKTVVKKADKYQGIATTDEQFTNYAVAYIGDTLSGTAYQSTKLTPSTARSLAALKSEDSTNWGSYNAETLFGKGYTWEDDVISTFTMLVEDGDPSAAQGGRLKISGGGVTYSLWLHQELFRGKYSEKSGIQTFKYWCTQNGTAGTDYFFHKTITQTPEILKEEIIDGTDPNEVNEALSYSLTTYGKTERITVTPRGNASALKSLAAIEYEVYKNIGSEENPAKGDLLQTGTSPVSGGSADINLTQVASGTKIIIALSAVYDSGYATGNPSYHSPASSWAPYLRTVSTDASQKLTRTSVTPLTKTRDFYAVQDSNTLNYIYGYSLGADQQHYRLSAGTTATINGGIFAIDDQTGSHSFGTDPWEYGVKVKRFTKQFVSSTGTTSTIDGFNLGYYDAGAQDARFNAGPYVFKLLRQIPIKAKLDASQAGADYSVKTVNEQQCFVFTTPELEPTVVFRQIPTALQATERSINYTITESSYKLITNADPESTVKYDEHLYFEVFESVRGGDGPEPGEGWADSVSDLPKINYSTDTSGNVEGISGDGESTHHLYRDVTLEGNGTRLFGDAFTTSTWTDENSQSHTAIGFKVSDTANFPYTDDTDYGGFRYNLHLDNLQPGHKYYLRIYALKDNKDGTYTKKYVIDSAPNSTSMVEYDPADTEKRFSMYFFVNNQLKTGMVSGVTNSDVTTAAYSAVGYGSQNLKVTYTIDQRYDVIYELSVEDVNTHDVFTSDDLMVMYNGNVYRRKPIGSNTEDYWDYDTHTWKPGTDYNFYKEGTSEGGTPILTDEKLLPNGYNVSAEFAFADDSALSAFLNGGSGEYNLILKARYENPFITGHYQQEGTSVVVRPDPGYALFKVYTTATDYTNGNSRTATRFTVPAKADPNLIAGGVSAVAYEGDATKVQTKVSVTVNDPSYRLGIWKDGVLEWGRYGLRIRYEENGSSYYLNPADIKVNGAAPTVNNVHTSEGDLNIIWLNAGASARAALTFDMKVGRQYYIEVWGVNANDSSYSSGTNGLVLSSNDVISLHRALLISDPSAPRIEDSKVDITTGGVYTITVYNAQNIGTINNMMITATFVHDDMTEQTYNTTATAKFIQIADAGGRTRYQLTFNMADVFSAYARNGDAVSVSAYLYKDGTLYIDSLPSAIIDSFSL